MFVRKGARIRHLIRGDLPALAGLVVVAVAVQWLEPYVQHSEIFSIGYVGILSTALSIFLVFRFNEAYERWWEARKLWGSLVNRSRDLARQCLIYAPDQARQVIHRQIAFVHALRIRLRNGASEVGRKELDRELTRVLPEEARDYRDLDNVPAALLERQTRDLAAAMGPDPDRAILLARVDQTLSGLTDVQGASERIKNTAFPDMVSLVTRLLVWGLAVLLFSATATPEGTIGHVLTVAVGIIAMGFIWIDSLGRQLNDPFENRPNDTPMTALCVGIERDLREMLGETERPPMPRPVDGILM